MKFCGMVGHNPETNI